MASSLPTQPQSAARRPSLNNRDLDPLDCFADSEDSQDAFWDRDDDDARNCTDRRADTAPAAPMTEAVTAPAQDEAGTFAASEQEVADIAAAIAASLAVSEIADVSETTAEIAVSLSTSENAHGEGATSWEVVTSDEDDEWEKVSDAGSTDAGSEASFGWERVSSGRLNYRDAAAGGTSSAPSPLVTQRRFAPRLRVAAPTTKLPPVLEDSDDIQSLLDVASDEKFFAGASFCTNSRKSRQQIARRENRLDREHRARAGTACG